MYHGHSYKSYLVVNVELTTVSSPMVKPGPPSDKAQRLSARLDTLLKQRYPIKRTHNHIHTNPHTNPSIRHPHTTATSPELFKLEQLCIARGKACWCLYVDLVVTSDDAGLFDGSLVALFAALRAVRLPHVAYHPEEDVVRCVERAGETAESAGRSLQLTRCVIPVTFGVFGGSVVADPDLAETPLMDTLVTLVLSLPASSSQPMEAEDEVVYHLIHKPGHTPVGLAMMQRLMAMSVTHAQHVKPTLLHE